MLYKSTGKFNWASLNIHFEDMAEGKFRKPEVIMRESISFRKPVSGFIIEIICYMYIDAEIQDPNIKDLISASHFSDNVYAVANSA